MKMVRPVKFLFYVWLLTTGVVGAHNKPLKDIDIKRIAFEYVKPSKNYFLYKHTRNAKEVMAIDYNGNQVGAFPSIGFETNRPFLIKNYFYVESWAMLLMHQKRDKEKDGEKEEELAWSCYFLNEDGTSSQLPPGQEVEVEKGEHKDVVILGIKELDGSHYAITDVKQSSDIYISRIQWSQRPDKLVLKLEPHRYTIKRDPGFTELDLVWLSQKNDTIYFWSQLQPSVAKLRHDALSVEGHLKEKDLQRIEFKDWAPISTLPRLEDRTREAMEEWYASFSKICAVEVLPNDDFLVAREGPVIDPKTQDRDTTISWQLLIEAVGKDGQVKRLYKQKHGRYVGKTQTHLILLVPEGKGTKVKKVPLKTKTDRNF